MKNRKRKQYQAAEKVSIIRQHLIEKESVADLCDKYGIAPSLYYRWQKQFFEGGSAAFESKTKTAVTQLQQEVHELEEKLTRKDEVLGEVMEEYVTLKKRVGRR
ncbi:MAG: transposase [Chloroflexi bacterium]|nr:transposase [Chloroflexota bacterium]